MIELAVATGRPLAELVELDDADLATFVDVVQAGRRHA
jgi:hypothetical protein